jgi:hypothetical protein
MPTSWNWLLSLRTWVLGAWILLWTVLGFAAMLINGVGTKLTAGPGRWVAFAALACTALLTLGISSSERLREAVVEPSKRELYDPQPFIWIGLITAVMAIQLVFARAPGS